jgi:hypothetical protein
MFARSVKSIVARRAQSTATSIESSWTSLAAQERTKISKQLDDKMKADWKTLSRDDKRAAYYISFGPHGGRTPAPNHGMSVAIGLGVLLGVSYGLNVFLKSLGGEKPHTLNKEWQEQTNEYLKGQKSDPIAGISSEGYQGKGHVQ